MKITGIETVVVGAGLRNWVFVVVDTDVPGLTGLGEATCEFQTRAVVGAVADLAELVIGREATEIERLWQILYRHPFFKGGPVTMSALSGIDQALHDLAAKELGVPLYRLLGGLVRDRVRLYGHLGGGAADSVYNEATATSFADRARELVADGYTALKILPVGRSRALARHDLVAEAVRLMAATREAVGDDVDVMVDFHGRTGAAAAIEVCRALEPMRPWFVEEICAPERPDELIRAARAVSVPVAAGERLYGRGEFLPLLRAGALDVAQPDVCHVGGITELRKIAALCDTFGVALAPHNPLGPVATMVNIHAALAVSNFLILEVMRSDVPWRDEVVDADLRIADGYAQPPSRPGIGVDLDRAAAARHPYAPVRVPQWFHDDGSPADW
jgi:galactonate dehydratase